MGEGLSTSISGHACFHQARVQRILQIPSQNTVLNQHITLCGIALVIDIQRAAPTFDRAVINDRDALGRDTLAHLA